MLGQIRSCAHSDPIFVPLLCSLAVSNPNKDERRCTPLVRLYVVRFVHSGCRANAFGLFRGIFHQRRNAKLSRDAARAKTDVGVSANGHRTHVCARLVLGFVEI